MSKMSLLAIFVLVIIQVCFFQNCGKMRTNSSSSTGTSTDLDTPDDPSTPNTPGTPQKIEADYYIRTDGGTSEQCNGKTNAAYSGSGTNQNCAWKSLTYALTMKQTPKIKSGDKVYIESGTYKIGYGQPGAETNPSECHKDWTYNCLMSAIPSGVTIEGNCTNRPKLVGVERVEHILNLNNSSNVTLRCLEITDNSECIVYHDTANGQEKRTCKRDAYPHGEWAARGITAYNSKDVLLDRVNVHGLAMHGINAAKLTNWELRDSNIDGNGWAGWDGDLGSTSSSNSGYMKFIRTTIRWNGCVEKLDGTHIGCWGQQQGGYGDGMGTAATGGSWLFDRAIVEYNTSDGIDLLYVRNAGGNVTVKNSYIAHNAGNQLKTNQDTVIENNVIIGDCAFHENLGATMVYGDYCRAMGNALSIGISGSQVATLKNNTISGEGDCLLLTSGSGGTINIDQNIMDGRLDYTSGGEQLTCGHYHDGDNLQTNRGENLIYNVKEGCPAGQTCQNPQFVNPVFETFDPHLKSGSPATGLGADLSKVAQP